MTRKNIRAVSRDHDEATVESLRKDPKFAVEYLNAVLQDGDEQELMVAMRRIADAMGGVPHLASKTKLNATTLYRTLSKKGNPGLRSTTSMLKAMGLRLAVQLIGKSGQFHIDQKYMGISADNRSACRRRREYYGPPPLSHGLSRFCRGRFEGTRF